ncbi:MAG: hypothetical protein Aurels2KO_49860 [Aureliella sp.]
MKSTLRWIAVGSLSIALTGCSGDTELSGSSGSLGSAPATEKQTSDPAAPKQDARKVLAAALTSAKDNDQRVFVHVGAPW